MVEAPPTYEVDTRPHSLGFVADESVFDDRVFVTLTKEQQALVLREREAQERIAKERKRLTQEANIKKRRLAE